MGALDDAIREHLELKRQHGARDSEIKELEDEAFGPPSRPGDPDFPARTPAGEGANGGAEGDTSDEPAAVVSPPAPEQTAPAPASDETAPPPPKQPPTELMDSPSPETEEAEAASTGAAELEAEETSPSFFDQQADHDSLEEDLGVDDLDLKLDDDVALEEPSEEISVELPAEELPAEPPSEEPGSESSEEAPVEDPVLQPTEEHPFEDEEAGEPPLEEESIEIEGEGEDEDVLEETPEFLRETPENEELWFDQGEPKDFDFEDEDQ